MSRHGVRNNMPGTPAFCLLVFRTEALRQFSAMDLARRAQSVVADVPRDLLARTAAFLLLKDSESSHAIEGESAPQDRIQRWGRTIGEAGRRPIDLLLRNLQQNGGNLSERGREQEFAQMTDAEVVSAEDAHAAAFRAHAESDIRG